MTAIPCPICGSPGEVICWRGASFWCRCSLCGQTFLDDNLPGLEEDLAQAAQAAEVALNEI